MRIAYIISAYKYPDQLVRLVRRLDDQGATFFIHMDKKSDTPIYQRAVAGLNDLPNVYFLKRHRSYWGGFGHVAASIKGLNELSRRHIAFDYAVLLTGQDYPIKMNTQIKDFLKNSTGMSYLDYAELPDDGPVSRHRIDYWHLRFGKHLAFPTRRGFRSRPLSLIWRVLISLFPWKRRFPTGFHPYVGSSYWCLSEECVSYITDFIAQNRAFVAFFRYVDIPDELFFHTLILNSPWREKVINASLTYFDWTNPAAGLPAILGQGDFEKLRHSSKLFARKFDTTKDAVILDLIDRELLKLP